MTSHLLRIAFVSYEFPPQIGGGIGTFVRAMSRILAARGHAVTVVTVGRERWPTRELLDGVTVVRLPGIESRGGGPLDVLRKWRTRGTAVADVLDSLSRGGLDAIEFADFRGEGVEYLSRTPHEKRPLCVLRMHAPMSVVNAYNPDRVRHELLEEYEHRAVKLADRLLSPSRVLSGEMRKRLGELTIELSPYPADPQFLDAGRDVIAKMDELTRRRDASREIVYFGRVEQIKGSETLARAAVRFLSECPDARLVMIGGDTEKSPAQPSMRQVVRSILPREQRDRIEFIETLPREQLLERLLTARCIVLPSHFDNFPNACLEAMCLGQCIVAGANSGMAEMLEDGVSGVLVPSADSEALAQALVRVDSMSGAQRAAIGMAARRRVEKGYHPDVIGAEVETLYSRFLGMEASRPRLESTGEERGRGQPPSIDRVTVVIPCFNHGPYLGDALASVRAQTHPNVECIVVNDGSTDPQTIAVLQQVERDGVRVVHQANQGLAAARNAGVRASAAPYFVPLDADDRIEPDFIETLLPVLRDDETLGFAYAHARFFGAQSGVLENPSYDPHRLLIDNICQATALVRRRAFDQAGGYSPDMTIGYEDWDFWLALLSAGWHGRLVPRPLFAYRKHAGGSMLSNAQRHRAELMRTMIRHHGRLFRSVLGEAGEVDERPDDDPLLARLAAEAELNHIESSRLWRLVKQAGLAPGGADGPGAAEHLARIKGSLAYRAIQRMKRAALYRWYAQRKYGPDFTPPV